MRTEYFYIEISNGIEKEDIRLKSESEFNLFKDSVKRILESDNNNSCIEQVNKLTNIIYSAGYLKKCKFIFQNPLS